MQLGSIRDVFADEGEHADAATEPEPVTKLVERVKVLILPLSSTVGVLR